MVAILLYHNVGGRGRRLNIAPRTLERQCRLLYSFGFRAMTLGEAMSVWLKGGNLGRRCVVFTFDDALAGVYQHALPILSRQGWQATVFAVSQRLGQVADWAGAPYLAVMSTEQLKHLHQQGWEVGSHSLTHPYLTRLPPSQARIEIMQSREVLEQILGAEVNTFCYPYGDFNLQIREIVQEAGYRFACTVQKRLVRRNEDPLALPRVAVAYRDGAVGLLYRLGLAWARTYRLA